MLVARLRVFFCDVGMACAYCASRVLRNASSV